ncbi:hypothetical protein LV84_04172 [Algoriphagus ratkowskyi]|uniref:Uncharacterized protein n=1 Tax=Algoriphagus ratkowskyi TaxID=57028 RepID=A0A2W7QUK7_9BACT|nr:hypothetical protein LV84_04172 [Algoriphagus ratkowskyi]
MFEKGGKGDFYSELKYAPSTKIQSVPKDDQLIAQGFNPAIKSKRD